MLLAWILGCGQDVGIVETSVCDGKLQRAEDTVDSPFDRDGDGYFDGNNAGCAATYPAEILDCDDNLPEVKPTASEVLCNELDDDCDSTTPDDADQDQDGWDACSECDDLNPDVRPGASEIACNGLDDDCNAATEDALDFDGDGSPECADCDDHDSSVYPEATEVACNAKDDDCNGATPDGEDFDLDGHTDCNDCDDDNINIYPGREEVCDNAEDDNCNGEVDESCTVDLSGTYTLDSTVKYKCAYGLVNINFSDVRIQDYRPDIWVSSGSGSQPGTMTGTLTWPDFTAENKVSGSCTEVYEVTGTFTSETTFEATFTASFVGGGACFDCKSQTWTVTGTK